MMLHSARRLKESCHECRILGQVDRHMTDWIVLGFLFLSTKHILSFGIQSGGRILLKLVLPLDQSSERKNKLYRS